MWWLPGFLLLACTLPMRLPLLPGFLPFDSRASFLLTPATPCLGREPKARVATLSHIKMLEHWMVDNQHISHFPKNALCLVASYNVCSFWHLRTGSSRPKNPMPGKGYSMITQCHSAIMKRNRWCKWINVNSNIICCTCAYKVEPTSRSPLASPFWMNCWPGNTLVYKI